MSNWLFIIPVVSAIIGWAGGWIAGKILVYQIIPRHKQYVAENIGRSVINAFPFSDLEEKISTPETINKVMPLVEDHVDDFLRNKLKAKMPVVGMLIGDKTISSLKEVFLKEIEEFFPHVLKKFAANLQDEMSVEKQVTEKINSMLAGQIEKMFLPVLRFFSLSGAVTGFIIGLINIALIVLIR